MKKEKKDSKTLLFEMMEKLNPELKKRKICETEIVKHVDFGETEEDFLTVTFIGDCKMVDVGIGSYEFWGSKGHDQRMEAECEDIYWDETKYSGEENLIINKYLDENFEDIQREIEEKFKERGSDDDGYGELDDFDYKFDR
jgi:wyosine [tRNA(Phe)-imidazoG37] synthetase (radical SAM superfamily)